MKTLAQFLTERLPGGLSHEDAAQLCLWLYCTVDGLPQQFHQQCTRGGLAETFATLSRVGWVRGGDSSDREHWDDVIASVIAKRDAVDMTRGKELVRQLGLEPEVAD